MSKEEKLLILQMVAEGKITPEQGAELLRAVGADKVVEPAKKPDSEPGKTGPKLILETGGKPDDKVGNTVRRVIDENIQKSIDEAVEKAKRTAEKAAEQAVRQAEVVAESVSRKAEILGKELAEKAPELGRTVGESVGESASALGRMIARMFTGGFFNDGPRFEFREETEGEFPEDGELDLNLSASNGHLVVEAWDRPGYRLEVRKVVHGGTEEEAKKMAEDAHEFRQDGLRLTARSKESRSAFFGPSLSVHFTLNIPRGRRVSMRLDTSNGRISVFDLCGKKLEARAANGRISLESCNFDEVRAHSANGRIEYRGSAGLLDLDTANGRVEAELRGAGDWSLSSSNGRILVGIKKDPSVAYEVDVSSVSGKIEVTGLENVDVLVDETDRRRVGSRRYRAKTKGFDESTQRATLKANTANGRITVEF